MKHEYRAAYMKITVQRVSYTKYITRQGKKYTMNTDNTHGAHRTITSTRRAAFKETRCMGANTESTTTALGIAYLRCRSAAGAVAAAAVPSAGAGRRGRGARWIRRAVVRRRRWGPSSTVRRRRWRSPSGAIDTTGRSPRVRDPLRTKKRETEEISRGR